MTQPALHPWNEHLWNVVGNAHSQELPAWLFTGPDGVGKFDCALAFATAKLCSSNQPGEPACGKCQQCVLISAGTHPDFHLVIPERFFDEDNEHLRSALRYVQDPQAVKSRKPRAIISIDQIRLLIENILTAAQISNEKVVVINPADNLNISAANALLKVLEEPPTNTTFILITSRPWKLPPTINSRTSRLKFDIPDERLALHWLAGEFAGADTVALELALANSGGAPIAARSSLHSDQNGAESKLEQELTALLQKKLDPLATAKSWQQRPLLSLLDSLQRLIFRLASSQMQTSVSDKGKSAMDEFESQIPVNRLFTMFDILGHSKTLIDTGVDETLMLEEICIDLASLVKKSNKPIKSRS